MKSESIGFIGVGNVGSNLANNLLKSNNNVFVYDKNRKSYSRLKKLKNEPCKTLKELTEKSSINKKISLSLKQKNFNLL